MPNIRIVSARVLTALAVVLVIGGASARAATSDPSEKTPALLAGLKPPHDAGLKPPHDAGLKSPHESNARSKATVHAANHGKKHFKIAAAHAPGSHARTDTAAPDAWPVSPAVVAADTAAASPAETLPPDNAPAPNEVVVGGQTVQVAAPDQVNAIDLAAGDKLEEAPAAATPEGADVAPGAPAAQSVLAAPEATQASQSAASKASWIAQAMAVLGGAVVAGAVAWFLIGSGPVRIYS
jgi:hypothetical protein